MKIGLISDLHTDVTPLNKALVPHLIDAVSAENLDVLVLAGDFARHLVQLSETLNAFHLADLACEKLLVPGNHDIWAIETSTVTSEQKCGIISELCHACGFHPLMDEPFIREKIGFCGTIGWYDYSFAPDGYDFSDAQYAEKELMGAVWNDKRYAKWNDTDPVVARRFEAALEMQIASIRDDVSRIVVVTHHVPFRECIRYLGELPWDFFRAFMGSKGLGAQCLREPLVTHALFGHTHQALDMQIDSVRAISAPVGYLQKEPTAGLQTYATQCLACFEV
ncbi:MAG: metallophosphoesterase [Candidatus Poribacteria bacterium]|nr:metallophosphoesterase [Candidatus Poribacteria bacterium]